MRGFIISLILFALIIGITAVYGVYWQKETEKLYSAALECKGEASAAKAVLIKNSINLLEGKRTFLHMSLRKSKIDAMFGTLNAAYYYCREGNSEEMNRYVSEALRELEEWRGEENLCLWNIL